MSFCIEEIFEPKMFENYKKIYEAMYLELKEKHVRQKQKI